MSVCVSGSGKTRRDWGYIYQGTLRKEMDYSIKDRRFGVRKKLPSMKTTNLCIEYFCLHITTTIHCQLFIF